MRFSEWVGTQPRGTLKRLERQTGVGYTTLQRLRLGQTLVRYDIARKLSEATGGEVSIDDLCVAPDRHGPKVRRQTKSRESL